jgi:NAD(P)-dependent dehydrogenase (short-subunit alcohol dehydrogenase family)
MYWPSLFGFRPPKPIKLHGKRVWILGASSGIGAALAARCAAEGARVALSAREERPMQQLRGYFPAADHLVLPLDVTDFPSMQRAYAKLMEQWGGVDVVVYLVGTYQKPEFSPLNTSAQLTMLDTNLQGIFRLLELLMPYWHERREGLLMLTGSFTAWLGSRQTLAYGASKAAIHHLAESLQLELAPLGIQVQRIVPGFVRTPMIEDLDLRMPFIRTPEQAANAIRRQMGRSHIFEIDFPWPFTRFIKLMKWLLPHSIFMWAANRFNAKAAAIERSQENKKSGSQESAHVE